MQTQTNRTEQWRIQKFLKGEDNLSQRTMFLLHGKNSLKIWANREEAAAPPLNQPLELHPYTEQWKQQLTVF